MSIATEVRADELGCTVGEAQEMFGYLDGLRESGVTNMLGAGSYLRDEFGIDKALSHKVLSAWMKDFS